MKGLRTKLTQKVGPLPVWAWALIAIVLAIGYRYYKAKSGANDAVNPAADPQQDSYYDGIYGGGIGPVEPPPDPGPLPDPVPVPVPFPKPDPVPYPGPPPFMKKKLNDWGFKIKRGKIDKDAVRRALKGHPLASKVIPGGRKHRPSTGIIANKTPPKKKGRGLVITHVKPKGTSPLVSSGSGDHPHEPETPPHRRDV